MAALVTMVLAGGIVLGGAVSASADSIQLCKGYSGCAALGMTNHGYSTANGTSYWRMYGGHNCTNYAAYMMVKAGMSNVRPWTNATGNAAGWGVGYAKKTNQTPTVGSVAWWKKGTGHVAYVEAVISPTEIIISEDSWGGDFYWRVIRKSGSGWPDGFVHFKDVTGVGAVPALRAKPYSTTVYTDATKSKLAVPTVMNPGSTAWVEMKFLNTGRAVWSKLSLATQEPNDHDSLLAQGWPALNRAAVLTEAAVIPGNVGTFGFAIRIPAGLADGTPVVENFAPVLEDGTRVGYGTSALRLVADSRSLFATQPTPSVAGVVAEGSVLKAVPGSWRPTTATLAYTWKRDGVAVPGATGTTYSLTAGDVGRKITVTVTASAARYISASKTSVGTQPVRSKFPDRLLMGDRLDTGGQIVSANGAYRLLQRGTGALVVQNMKTGKITWTSKATGAGGYTVMYSSGSLAGFTKAGKIVWSSGTRLKAGVTATLSGTGRLSVINAAGKVLWARY